jgi:membrane protease YdiL (CAAX protease family)
MSESKQAVARDVALFVALTGGASALFGALIVHSGHMATGRWLYVRGAMWGPAIAVGILSIMRRRSFDKIGWKWNGPYELAAYGLSIGAVALVYILAWAGGFAGFPNARTVASIANDFGWVGAPTFVIVLGYAALMATLGLLPAIASVLGEEIGWRGYLVPELARVFSFTQTAFISGVIWTVWHYPMLALADYNRGGPAWFSAACFSTFILSASVICAWFRLKSGSIWPAVILHATNNLLIQDVFTPLSVDTGPTKLVVDQFGFLLPLAGIAIAVICWRRRAEVEQAQPATGGTESAPGMVVVPS